MPQSSFLLRVCLLLASCMLAASTVTTATWTCTAKSIPTVAATGYFSKSFTESTECVGTLSALSMSDCTSWIAYKVSVSFTDSTNACYGVQATVPTTSSAGAVTFKTTNSATPSAIVVQFRGYGGACTSTCSQPSSLITFNNPTTQCTTVSDPNNYLATYNSVSSVTSGTHRAFAVDASSTGGCKVVAVSVNKNSECSAAWDVVSKSKSLSWVVYGLNGITVTSTMNARLMGCDGLFEIFTIPTASSITTNSNMSTIYSDYSAANAAKVFTVSASASTLSSWTQHSSLTGLAASSTLSTCDLMFAGTASYYSRRSANGAVWNLKTATGSATAEHYISSNPCASKDCGNAVCTWCCDNTAVCSDCPRGYTGSTCTACAVGTYKTTTGSGACTSCPANSSTSATGSTSVTSCVCNSNYSGTITSATSTCTHTSAFVESGASAIAAAMQPK
eukprot:c5198_g1_i1.p1 GENE.c5198_g1_i1~~c5198_g1_i1.p1  ORF type:complete len:459 (+),score=132.41 c5198_g1_i1:35-1378(+)